ncbi:helix-hairpin-helix domain-containing protein [Nocardioides sp. ChNu-153]|uniref:helix-hairpin-helix domain-containing protein n=1 Tax=unclassified Nocardioides TaxID=2615069 RepID=UPI002404BEF7|nr:MULTISPECIES: helix-hairpin-helix domain-containing protein [unclassified Nocardioides]MDF9716834.1 helix-hairpin-helix domain-containing protein [Nocardioides sp. ChNu-99]MDN7120220.1 helix-hairpin-helix domain-containing protein [Nocardioides sp. ChNu-153]
MSNGRNTTLVSWLWALVPAVTLGLGTPAIMAHAAVKKRSRAQAVAVAVYLAAVAALFGVDRDRGGLDAALFTAAMVVLLFVGLAHAVAIRAWVFADDSPAVSRSQPSPVLEQQAAAVAVHRETVAARETARHLMDDQPALAHELRIGRPDLVGRTFPDGGLVDVNRVDARTLAQHAHLPLPLAEQVVAVRDGIGGYGSFDDLVALSGVPPHELDPARGVLVFSRRLG